jgi:uncharacterized Rmd1/YagE family protein
MTSSSFRPKSRQKKQFSASRTPIIRRQSRPLPGSNQRQIITAADFFATANMVAERIDVRKLNHLDVIGQSPLLIRLPERGVAAVFRYGVVVTFNATPEDRNYVLEQVSIAASGEGDDKTEEQAIIVVDPTLEEGPSGNSITIREPDKLRLQLIAETMAKAVILSSQENRASHDFDRVEPLAQDLAEDGKFSVKPEELLKAAGSMLLAEHRLNGRAEVRDKPDLLTDNPELEGLYARLQGDYELQERSIALDRKLTTLSHTSETLVETMRHHSSHRLEVLITILISVELCLAAYSHIEPFLSRVPALAH